MSISLLLDDSRTFQSQRIEERLSKKTTIEWRIRDENRI